MSILAINNKYMPMQISANAKLHIKNLGTLNSPPLNKTTIITARLPTRANIKTNQTDIRNKLEPIISSHGFNASGSG